MFFSGNFCARRYPVFEVRGSAPACLPARWICAASANLTRGRVPVHGAFNWQAVSAPWVPRPWAPRLPRARRKGFLQKSVGEGTCMTNTCLVARGWEYLGVRVLFESFSFGRAPAAR